MGGIIYLAINKLNGKAYVGATTKTMDERKSDHLTKAKNECGSVFHRAISKYGPDVFHWEEIASAKSVNELAFKERFFIRKHDSFKNGYNEDRGGGLKKEIYSYWKDGELIGIYPSLARAAIVVLGKKKGVSNACLGNNHTYKGLYWSYRNFGVYPVTEKSNEKKVKQYTLKGHLIKEYPSASEAARISKIGKSNISRVCRGERGQAGGYTWKYI